MTISTNTTDRKAMAKAMAEHLGTTAKYMGVPSCGYQVGDYIVDKEGNIHGDDFETLRDFLQTIGCFPEEETEPVGEQTEPESETTGTVDQVSVSVPADDLTPAQLKNLIFTLYTKQYLIGKMTGGDLLNIPDTLIARLMESTPESIEDFKVLLDAAKDDGLTGFDFEDCVPLADEVFLIRINQSGKERLICVDHGAERYQVEIPAEAYSILPDGHGGFFCPDSWPTGDYSPEILMHYNKDGRTDQTVSLSGDKVVITVTDSYIDPQSGLCTIYGSAAAASRKIYSVFAMTIDGDMRICDLDVRNIDPVYRDYSPTVKSAPDGAAYVFICEYEGRKGLKPVLIPFFELERSKSNYGITVN